MPQITVDYSATLEEDFDRRGYALALHPVVVETAGARLPACKTRTRRSEQTVIADGGAEEPLIHITVALVAGRTEEAKAALAEAAVALTADFLKPGLPPVHISAEVRDLDPSYRQN
ncbi:isomerase [Streptomyces sp. NPDC046887]|uniref:5-carboxymethyl-2-hydroxymuconate Delta-isomerase n=1 Tax=Streptomyces sp. NPDC046887 TaxID=3155472 RepID=UPI0033CABAF9